MQNTLPTNASMAIILKTEYQFREIFLIVLSLMFFPVSILAQPQKVGTAKLATTFDGKYGQVEVGGNFAGAEFHDSRPLPSRISFYYPVANSIDLSTDYWKRGDSKPFSVFVDIDGRTDTLGNGPCVYSWTPYEADFTYSGNGYNALITYSFCDDTPFMVVRMVFTNLTSHKKTFRVRTALSMVLRTCQTYAWRKGTAQRYSENGNVCIADFKYVDTDSTAVIVANAGKLKAVGLDPESATASKSDSIAKFTYDKTIEPHGRFSIAQLIGSCRVNEASTMVKKALSFWQASVKRNEERVTNYVYRSGSMKVPDRNLEHTALWSKAMLATDRHFINGSIVPMPCPAEYNFFFTHDVLLTDLGAVYYDLARVKHDLMFIRSITHADSILPHAYYWRDDGFKTEFAEADNWNHLWFMIVCGTYLKHSDDEGTLRLLYPILKKSAEMALSNLGPGGLAYSTRPDWWDIGNNYGARSYLTALMIRALGEYCYVAQTLATDGGFVSACLHSSDMLKKNLEEKLWDPRVAYLLNTIDTNTVDYHYYAGSLVAVDFGVLSEGKSDSLIQTAQRELLDSHLGLRNAMPDDFDSLASLYQFKDGEAGGKYIYMNGAVWPQTNAWYILALIQLNRVNEAKEALDKFLSIGGIERSPYGQPSFYEYRYSDPDSPLYGKIDKPNFLWAGGWYLNALYHLAGVRENEWNIYLTPHIPEGFKGTSYNLTAGGRTLSISWTGEGRYFRRLTLDGRNMNSAVMMGKGGNLKVELGFPLSPYLATASCAIDSVAYSGQARVLDVFVRGSRGQDAYVKVVSPKPIIRAIVAGRKVKAQMVSSQRSGACTISLHFVFGKDQEKVHFEF
jgi:Amylo-alpha-1,6-glucosidase